MKKYFVYLEPRMAIEIEAEGWDIKNSLLKFFIGDTYIACFSMNVITGFRMITNKESEK